MQYVDVTWPGAILTCLRVGGTQYGMHVIWYQNAHCLIILMWPIQFVSPHSHFLVIWYPLWKWRAFFARLQHACCTYLLGACKWNIARMQKKRAACMQTEFVLHACIPSSCSTRAQHAFTKCVQMERYTHGTSVQTDMLHACSTHFPSACRCTQCSMHAMHTH